MTDTLTKHFVTFYSPGTFFDEQSTEEVKDWDIEAAKKRARKVKERYGATPWGFQFSTQKRGPKDFNAKETARSPLYFLGGKIETLAEVEARKDPQDEILLSNMRCNGFDKIITNTNSWKVTKPFQKGNVILDFKP